MRASGYSGSAIRLLLCAEFRRARIVSRQGRAAQVRTTAVARPRAKAKCGRLQDDLPPGRSCPIMAQMHHALAHPTFADLRDALAGIAPGALAFVERAYAMAELSHAGQVRDEGAPFIEHPLRVALI